MRFKEKILSRKKYIDSPIVFALDLHSPFKKWVDAPQKQQQLYMNCKGMIEKLAYGLAGVKIGFPLLLSLGSKSLHKLMSEVKNKDRDLVFIGDFKIADIGNTNLMIVRHLFDLGLDAVIFHTFIGYVKGFDSIVEEARSRELGTIGVVYMSHSGAVSFFEKIYKDLVAVSLEHGLDGLIVPGTRPHIIQEIKDSIKEKMILLTPGIGVQGGDPKRALNAGANFLIVGRSLYSSKDPSTTLDCLLSMTRT